jgi:uncharacterized protein
VSSAAARPLRVVFDTNVLVSAALRPMSRPGRCLRIAIERGAVVVSDETVVELADVLLRAKFDAYVSTQTREAFILAFIEQAEVVQVTQAVTVCRDPEDNKFLEAAVSGSADCLVTGDEDLLALHPFRNIPILAPAAFLEEAARTR